MVPVGQDDDPPFDFWPYAATIPADDFDGHDCSRGTVSNAYRHPEGKYLHVHLEAEERDVFMVLVLDVGAKRVIGHRLLDLPRLYGLRSGSDGIVGEPG